MFTASTHGFPYHQSVDFYWLNTAVSHDRNSVTHLLSFWPPSCLFWQMFYNFFLIRRLKKRYPLKYPMFKLFIASVVDETMWQFDLHVHLCRVRVEQMYPG